MNGGAELLVDAERRFLNKLCKAMTPIMISAFWELFTEAKNKSRTATMGIFQMNLQRVKGGVEGWGDVIVKQHVDAILKEEPMFPKLLASVFIIHVKILSSIRTNNQSKKISISLPGNNLFVHSCYIRAANMIYDMNRDGESLFGESISHNVRHERLTCLMCNAIRETVEQLIPFDIIMNTYLPGGNDAVEFGGDEEAPAPEEEDEDMLPEPEAEGEAEAEGEGEEANDVAETPGGHQVKEIAVTPGPSNIPTDSGTLFDDAPVSEGHTKNPVRQ
jgi:hypothetical protein